MNNIIFVSAQPDVPYFHWQSKIYIHNFIENGIKPENIHVIFGLVNGNRTPSDEGKKLSDTGVNVHFYVDDREKKSYIPSIKPFLIHKWLKEDESRGKLFFLHDADIIFRELPNFDLLVNDDITYMSDTIGYIGYEYIISCCRRYEQQHISTYKNQLIEEMAEIIGIDVLKIEENQKNSGGGQYLIKNTDSDLWCKIYCDCTPLYDQMMSYQKRFPINNGQIQFWTAEMWSLLWNLWLHNKETKITDELSFSWATDDLKKYEERPILHMAGVTENLKDTKFYKGDYINVDPLVKLSEDDTYFDYIDPNSSTIKYVEVMKSYLKK